MKTSHLWSSVRRLAAVIGALLAGAADAADANWRVEVNARLRVESRDQNFTFNAAVPSVTDDAWLLTRLRVGVQGEVASGWTFHGQMQDSRELASSRPSVPFVAGSEGDDPFDLRQLYFEKKRAKVIVRVGRQTLAFGDERLVGPLEWNNFARSFDALRVTLPKIGGGLDAFVSSVVQVQPGSGRSWRANHSSRHDIFGGLYSRFAPANALKVEPYVFWRAATAETVYSAGAAGSARPYDVPQRIATLGARITGGPADKLGGFDYDAEMAGQFGDVHGRQLVTGTLVYPGPIWLEQRAWAAHAGVGYSFKTGGRAWRLYAEANRASGDRDPADVSSESFLNLFPTNHKFYGGMDAFAWKNLREIALSVTTVVLRAKVRLEQHWFALDRVSDTWFRANGVTAVRPLTQAARRASRRAGAETDLVVSLAIDPRMTIEGGWSYFAAGRYLRDTGGASDATFVYAQTSFQW